MRFALADGLFGLSNATLAVFVSVVALIFTVRRWRQVTMKKSVMATQFRPSPEAGASNTARSLVTGPLNVREVATELGSLLAELEETSRRLTAQLDNRYTRIEQLLTEADEKIRRLESLTQSTSPAPAAGKIDSIPAPVVAPAISDAQRTLSRLRQERGAPPPAQDPAYQPIYSLADGGKSSREIALELGRQPGEIELILALRQR